MSCSAYRTPICKAKRGGFKDTHADDLLAPVLKVGYTSFVIFAHKLFVSSTDKNNYLFLTETMIALL